MAYRRRYLAFSAAAALSVFPFSSIVHARPAASVDGPEASPQETVESITVVGERLRRAGGVIGMNPLTGKMKCKVLHPSGVARIDTAACDIALRCAKENRRNRELFRGCVDAGYDEFLKTYFDS